MSFTDIGTLTTRKADTLVYTQAEVNDIISRFSSNLVNFETDKNALTQRLEFLTKKETSLQLHSDTLIEYLKVKRIPRGLRLGIKPTLCKEDPAFCRNWDRILNKCSLDLMTLTVEGIQSKLSKLRIDISNIKQKLQSSYSDVNLDELDVKLRDTVDKHRVELLKVKLDKFRRDTVDYQEDRVYNWRRPYYRRKQFNTSGGTRGKYGEGGKGKKGSQEPSTSRMSTRKKTR
ncbi:hypothetical protein XELAEV_18004376mg [Xenopus laevis]|uniref:Uncharacterized protein n=1 Tax=Xenopus laevis TaxID=8355 RepID=A0A974BPE5_XENLA|nr:hypothetical protein XELAEV_18004376mg [Xenopus laevis]